MLSIVTDKAFDIAIDEVVLAFVVVATPGWIAALADNPLYIIYWGSGWILQVQKKRCHNSCSGGGGATLKRESAS